MIWLELLQALGLVLVLEGLMPAIAPERYSRMLGVLSRVKPASLRAIGLVSMVVGALVFNLLT